MFDGKYLDWNQKRIKGIIDFYGHQFLNHKKVLDLGCGHADISGALHRLGADITAVDARQEHLKVASRKYPGIKTVKADLDRGWPFYGKTFDIILHLDLLCHLSNFEEHLRAVCASTTHLILEIAVCDSEDPHKTVVSAENKSIYDLSANGISCKPSVAAIERVLKECGMNFRRQDNARFNSGSYVYDWQAKNDGSADYNRRRLWLCVKTTSTMQFVAPPTTTTITPPLPASIGFVPTLQDTRIPIQQFYAQSLYAKNQTPDREPAKKVKTALCISGHLRTFEDNYQSVKTHILDKLDCDVFIHTWDIMGLSYRFTDGSLYAIETQRLAERIKQLYNPKKMVMEPAQTFKASPLMHARQLDHRDIPGILSMYYKIEACNKLKSEYEKEQNFKYDCVIRFRGDLYMESDLPIDNITNLNYLFVPIFGNFGGVCDQFAYGSSDIMNVYSSLYSNINKYMESGAPMHPERLLQFHVDVNKLPLAKVNVRYLIKRANGLIQDNMILERVLGMGR
jgi:SAM-dependent methyltransferase